MEGTSARGMFVMFLKRLGPEGHILISKGFFLRQFAVFLEESSPFISINYVWSHSTGRGWQAQGLGHQPLPHKWAVEQGLWITARLLALDRTLTSTASS